ncbi:MAG: hypothetical protein OXN17_02040 [Candidatus Poribacteria bacterium]|nr:hypothetical protein [Candidatus Poribacteria bacterium]MDE0503705.1 hypothetical protein [Candidatus Poribacteria bacterium]
MNGPIRLNNLIGKRANVQIILSREKRGILSAAASHIHNPLSIYGWMVVPLDAAIPRSIITGIVIPAS